MEENELWDLYTKDREGGSACDAGTGDYDSVRVSG